MDDASPENPGTYGWLFGPFDSGWSLAFSTAKQAFLCVLYHSAVKTYRKEKRKSNMEIMKVI